MKNVQATQRAKVAEALRRMGAKLDEAFDAYNDYMNGEPSIHPDAKPFIITDDWLKLRQSLVEGAVSAARDYVKAMATVVGEGVKL